MIFAWQGFSFEHPDDWAPVTITGSRWEGYVRIASPTRYSFQARWKLSKQEEDLNVILARYLDRLARDAKSAKIDFRSHTEEHDGRLTYRYTSSLHGRGAILHSKPCGRVFFLEAISAKNDSLLPHFKRLLDSFNPAQHDGRWALFGLDLRLPDGLDVEKKVLLAGRTQLTLSCKQARIEAQRWGLAEQLVSKHGLETWTRSVLDMTKAASSASEEGILLQANGSLMRAPTFAMSKHQRDRNQITTVKVTTRREEWRPNWNWFA